jgi:2-dehydropantoate 2-reductase
MAVVNRPRVAVLGAGCIGAWVGGMLARAGCAVTLIGRARLKDAVDAHGLHVAGLGEAAAPVPLTVALGPEGAAEADVLVVAVKGRDSASAAASVRPHLRPDAVVVSFQNGLRNPDRLRGALPEHRVVPGMVSFNVVWDDAPGGGARFRQLTSGPVAMEGGGAPGLATALRAVGVDLVEVPDMQAVQWAKLVLNLNNAVNALSGVPLAEELAQRGYRRVLAAAMNEAWAAMDAGGIRPAAIGKMRPRLAPRILPLPDWLFRVLAAPMIRIDPAARSSMSDDLSRGRPTEVLDINGEVVALGQRVGVTTPVNARLVALIQEAEAAGAGSPRLQPEALLGA